ncbi:MAG: DUF3881 family protein, partial [Clostridiales bacterium]|nr:DUF3881 family protein [Clostridiales bacterium]
MDSVIRHPDEQYVDRDSYGNDVACFSRYVGSEMGVTVCGSFAGEDKFRVEYYFPFFKGSRITTAEPVEIDRQAAGEQFYGFC